MNFHFIIQATFRQVMVAAKYTALLILIHGNRMVAQTTPINPVEILTYDQKTETRFILNSGLNTSDWESLDWSYVMPYSEECHVEKSVDPNGNLTLVFSNIQESLRKNWMTQPDRIVIDQTSITSYDSAGAVLSQQTHSGKALTAMQELNARTAQNGLQPLTAFPALNSGDLDAFLAEGWNVDRMDDGSVRVSKDGLTILNEPAQMRITTTTAQEGRPFSSVEWQYAARSQGDIVPERTVTRTYPDLPTHACVEKVTTITYTNYSYTHQPLPRNNDIRELDGNDKEKFSISPNPVENRLDVIFSSMIKNALVSIFNPTGELIRSKPVTDSRFMQFSLENLPAGTYFLQVNYGDQKETKPFIKK